MYIVEQYRREYADMEMEDININMLDDMPAIEKIVKSRTDELKKEMGSNIENWMTQITSAVDKRLGEWNGNRSGMIVFRDIWIEDCHYHSTKEMELLNALLVDIQAMYETNGIYVVFCKGRYNSTYPDLFQLLHEVISLDIGVGTRDYYRNLIGNTIYKSIPKRKLMPFLSNMHI